MDKVSFPYRSGSHLSLLHVISESGAWERHGLEVDYDKYIGSDDAHRDLPSGAVEFIGGNHVSTYGHRARGDKWVYLGQTVNSVVQSLCVRPDSGISHIQDLRGKKFLARGSHPTLNDWLFLKQRGLDADRDDIELVDQIRVKQGSMDAEPGQEAEAKRSKWEWVKEGKVDACFVTTLHGMAAAQAGMKIIDIESLPMIQFTTVSAHQDFVEKHPDLVERFLKGMIEGIATLKTQPETAKRIIKARYMNGALSDDMVNAIYDELARLLEPKLYPTMEAISNVYQEALYQDADSRKVNPLSLWNLNYIRRIDDSGFVDALYGNKEVV
jgi:ABC-type nitrate/sulfonate/bicarbonate transport system substrate-binding protein